MPCSSIFTAAGLSAATSRSASRPLLATMKYPPAWLAMVGEGRAQGRLVSMLMLPSSISFCRGQRRPPATGRLARTDGWLSSPPSHSSNALVLGRVADDGGQTNHHAL